MSEFGVRNIESLYWGELDSLLCSAILIEEVLGIAFVVALVAVAGLFTAPPLLTTRAVSCCTPRSSQSTFA